MPFFHRGLEEFRDLALVGDVRYIGFMGAIELVKDKKTKQAITDRINERLEDAWAHYQYKEGLRVSFATVNKQGQTEEIQINDRRRMHDTP